MKERIIKRIFDLRNLQANVTPAERAKIEAEIRKLYAVLDAMS